MFYGTTLVGLPGSWAAPTSDREQRAVKTGRHLYRSFKGKESVSMTMGPGLGCLIIFFILPISVFLNRPLKFFVT